LIVRSRSGALREAEVTNPNQADGDVDGVGDGVGPPAGPFLLVTTNCPVIVVGCTSQRKKYVPAGSAAT
jgi:hypothetical protein